MKELKDKNGVILRLGHIVLYPAYYKTEYNEDGTFLYEDCKHIVGEGNNFGFGLTHFNGCYGINHLENIDFSRLEIIGFKYDEIEYYKKEK